MSPGVRQAAVLLVLAAAGGLAGNALREKPLPWSGSLDPPPPPELGAGLSSLSSTEALSVWEEGAIFVDLRERDAFDERRVAGAMWLGPEDLQMHYFDEVADLPLEMPLFLYGAGADSFGVRRAAAELGELGHEDVRLAVCGAQELFDAGVPEEAGP